MVDVKDGMKYWRDAGHVARRTLEATKDVLTVGTPWKDVIEFAERHIHRHGGSPAFPTTIGVNKLWRTSLLTIQIWNPKIGKETWF